jgi:pimeloyl-ACP methyl ester carboxylesterase
MARVAYLQADVHRSGAPPELQLRDDAPPSRRTVARGLADIAVPVQLLYVGQDVFVPTGHGEWLTQHIPGVEAHLLDDDGHATLVNHVHESHAWLSEHLCASTLIGMRARLRFRGRRTEEVGHTQLDMAGQPR